jgi:hypothetical protein
VWTFGDPGMDLEQVLHEGRELACERGTLRFQPSLAPFTQAFPGGLP